MENFNPNFPLKLDIHPSHSVSILQDELDVLAFGSDAQELAILQYGIAGRVWEAAYAMTLYVSPASNQEFDPPFILPRPNNSIKDSYTIMELGSGSGLVASCIARVLELGRDHIIVTDLPEVLPLLENNLRIENGEDKEICHKKDLITIKPLRWGNFEDVEALASSCFNQSTPPMNYVTHIICSDLIYFPELLGPLLRSLLQLSSPPFFVPNNARELKIVVSYKIRSLVKEAPFWSAFGLWFDFIPVVVRDKTVDDLWQRFGTKFDDLTFIFVAHRRPDSYSWNIPLQDDDLLAGVGANGTNTRKSDDTFEAMLLLSVEQN